MIYKFSKINPRKIFECVGFHCIFSHPVWRSQGGHVLILCKGYIYTKYIYIYILCKVYIYTINKTRKKVIEEIWKKGRNLIGKNFGCNSFKENRNQDLQCFWHKIAIALCKVIFDFEYQNTNCNRKNPMSYQNPMCYLVKRS